MVTVFTDKYLLAIIIIFFTGHPEKLQIQLTHVRQKYNWDCGISCVLMVLPKKSRQEFLRNFSNICKSEGFEKRLVSNFSEHKN